jgi:metal-responsive CopG/Arc/MetJ family transcriptional regulator
MNYVQIVDVCCRDLRRYLETALKTAKGGVVTVKMRRLLRAELSPPDRVRYSRCLSRVLHAYRWGAAYVIPRQDAEKLLESFDELCQSARQVKSAERPKEPKPRRQKEDAVFISVAVPSDLLYAVDTYAHLHGVSRAEVVRQAIQKLIEMRHALEELDRARDGQLRVVALRLPRDLLTALNERAAALKATRAAVIRYAIYKLIEKIKKPAET